MTTHDDDIAIVALQEKALQFPAFDLASAWQLGAWLQRQGAERGLGIAIDVHLHAMPAFYAALPGSTPDNANWIRRKRNTVLRLFRSSYSVGLTLARHETTLEARLGLSAVDFAAHGGSFPIVVRGTGCIGAVTVSGLPQREDHNLVVEGLGAILEYDLEGLRLS